MNSQLTKPISLEAVSVCVDYADFLAEIAPHNLPHLSRWIVITTPRDEETQRVCRRFGIEIQTTEEVYTHGDGPFNKARAINKALQQCRGDGWLLHLDSDIALPLDFALCLRDAHLDPECIYGCDRFNVIGELDWAKCKARGLFSRRDGWLVDKHHPHATVKGPVCMSPFGYSPIGFFQLWWGSQSLNRTYPGRLYPEGHGNAARTDTQFALQWDRRHRVMIPELMVYHLESEPSHQGRNWSGRKSRRFGPGEGKSAARSARYEGY